MGNRCGIRALLIVHLAIVSSVNCASFEFPEFVAIEGNGGDVCGGWIIDKQFRPQILTTEACVKRGNRGLRQLLVRYGSAEITGRTSSLAVDRLLKYQNRLERQLVVLSTHGRLQRNPVASSPTDQRYNGTSLLTWHRKPDGVLHKTLLQITPEQRPALKHLIDTLRCRDAETQEYLLEGALILENLNPSAMLTVRLSDDSAHCGVSVDMLELNGRSDAPTMIDMPRMEPAPDSNFPLTEPNSPFGYIAYIIFMGYCILYTVMFFIFGLMRAHPSTDL